MTDALLIRNIEKLTNRRDSWTHKRTNSQMRVADHVNDSPWEASYEK